LGQRYSLRVCCCIRSTGRAGVTNPIDDQCRYIVVRENWFAHNIFFCITNPISAVASQRNLLRQYLHRLLHCLQLLRCFPVSFPAISRVAVPNEALATHLRSQKHSAQSPLLTASKIIYICIPWHLPRCTSTQRSFLVRFWCVSASKRRWATRHIMQRSS
jgi:hypothetical protein